jgi:hypothetical protein
VLFSWGHRRAVAAAASGSDGSFARALQPGSAGPDNMGHMAGEKRDRERVPLDGQVRGEVMVFQPMTVLDISMGGAQIETSFALQLDSLHDFRLSLGDRSVIVKGRVAHCHIGELTDVAALYRSGIEFADVSDHARRAIIDFVRATQYSRTGPDVVDGVIAEDDTH